MPLGVDRLLGLLARMMGNFDRAMAHFEDALAFCRKAGYRPELAWTCFDYADTLLGRASTSSARTDDRHKAMSMLDESLSLSTELGMRPLTERAVALKEKAESQPVAAPLRPDGLTQREVEVLRMVAAGESNLQIADELVLSIRTVERHISNSYRKIKAKSRVDATAYALRHNLAD